MDNYEISLLKQEHLSKYAEIYSKAFFGTPWFDPWKEEEVLIHLKENTAREQVYGLECQVEGKVVGFVFGSSILYHYGRSFDITDVAVDPMYQCRGIGRKLMEQMLADLKEQGVVEVQLVTTGVGALPAFFEELGFKKVKEAVTMGQKL